MPSCQPSSEAMRLMDPSLCNALYTEDKALLITHYAHKHNQKHKDYNYLGITKLPKCIHQHRTSFEPTRYQETDKTTVPNTIFP